MLRLDKFLADSTVLSRRDAAAAIRAGRVTVDGQIEKAPERKVAQDAAVALDGAPLCYARFRYYMLNKPAGYVSSTDDPGGPTVLELLPEEQRAGLFPCGRLDKNTTGLLILMNDGKLAHDLLSPKKHVVKEYYFEVERPVTPEDVAALEKGVDIGTCVTLPCKIELTGERRGVITLREGKYHQIKEMFKVRMNKITALRRISFGGVRLDENLPEGAWRALTAEELNTLTVKR